MKFRACCQGTRSVSRSSNLPTMLSPFLSHVPREKWQALCCNECSVQYDWNLSFERVKYACPRASRSVGVPNIHCFRDVLDTFRHHLLQGHVPERCAVRVKIITVRIVKMHAYPAAHGGFSDIWDCRLQHEQKPPERVRSPGMNASLRTMPIIGSGGCQGHSTCRRE